MTPDLNDRPVRVTAKNQKEAAHPRQRKREGLAAGICDRPEESNATTTESDHPALPYPRWQAPLT